MKHVYFMGIAGTGMAAVAGLAKAAGFKVTGSDKEIYPPMSTMLEQLGIPVLTPYSATNLAQANPDLVIVANALSRGHEELESLLATDRPYTSFPKFLGDHFLKNRTSIVVAGTHGKTTTTSLMSHVLQELGESPSFMIGGIPRNFPYSFQLGTGPTFVIEGDEYDTAFFDKESKFLHYHPKHLILNNLEYDHADIFPNIEAIEKMFAKLISLTPQLSTIIANVDDPGISKLLKQLGIADQVFRVSTLGRTVDAPVRVVEAGPLGPQATHLWQATIQTPTWNKLAIKTNLVGEHNTANIAQVIACLETLSKDQQLKSRPTASQIQQAFASFKGVARRLDLLARIGGVDIFEDFAHHPTAVKSVIHSVQKALPGRRVLVAFDPRNATSRRNVFTNEFAQSLRFADQVYIGKCTVDQRIPEHQRMDTKVLAEKIGQKAKSYEDNDVLLADVSSDAKTGDAIIFMSSGSFSGIQYRLADELNKKFGTSR